jgi:hypothetical protein
MHIILSNCNNGVRRVWLVFQSSTRGDICGAAHARVCCKVSQCGLRQIVAWERLLYRTRRVSRTQRGSIRRDVRSASYACRCIFASFSQRVHSRERDSAAHKSEIQTSVNNVLSVFSMRRRQLLWNARDTPREQSACDMQTLQSLYALVSFGFVYCM